MEILGQVCSGLAMAAFLVGSGAGFAAARLGSERARWAWRGGTLFGAAALLLSVALRGASSSWLPLSRVDDRAALVALLAGLLSVGLGVRNPSSPPEARGRWGLTGNGWAELIPAAVVAGVSAVNWPDQALASSATTASFMLVCTLLASALALWSAGQGLDVLLGAKSDSHRAAAVAFAGLTVSVVVVGWLNWRVWGTPGGTLAAPLGLLAVWLISAARLVLHQQSAWLSSTLDLLAATLLVVIALRVEWTLPFG